MKRKPVFFTSDWHLGHDNCIKFDNRPFKHTDEMHEALIYKFNKQVPIDGITYFLGDIVLCNQELALSVISRLNGIKILIRGNHDKGVEACYNAGFDIVMNSASITIANTLVTMTHCPLRGLYREDTTTMKGRTEGENWHGENRHPDFSIESFGQFHLHGHIHSPNKGQSQKILGRQYDVGVTANNYIPVHIGVIDSWIQKTKWLEKQATKED
jgi:calcineurin-like phosphoesterase family protein